MLMASALPPMTAEEFFALPEPTGDFTYELHFGELIKVGRSKKGHLDLQSLIRRSLERMLSPKRWRIEIEMPYGLTPGYDARAADVGVAFKKKVGRRPRRRISYRVAGTGGPGQSRLTAIEKSIGDTIWPR